MAIMNSLRLIRTRTRYQLLEKKCLEGVVIQVTCKLICPLYMNVPDEWNAEHIPILTTPNDAARKEVPGRRGYPGYM